MFGYDRCPHVVPFYEHNRFAASALAIEAAWLLFLFRTTIIAALDTLFDLFVDHVLSKWLK